MSTSAGPCSNRWASAPAVNVTKVERASGPWDLEEFERAAGVVVRRLRDYVERSQRGDGPALNRAPLEEVEQALDLRRRLRDGGMDSDDFDGFLAGYLERTTRLHHPGSLAHQVPAPDIPSALADFVHGAINNPMAIQEMGAAALAIERAVVEWMLEKVGWSAPESDGVLTHGGSLANLTAMLAARARAVPSAWADGVPGDLAVLAPASAHYSVARSVAIAGMGHAAFVPIETDDLERIRPDCLDDALERARGAGRRPIALVADACATGTGLFDDLTAVAAFCREHDLWLHVDGAHGASALLSPRHRHLLRGIEEADSVVWDAHKMLRTSSLCAAVLVRRAPDLPGAFQQEASYLFYDGENPDIIDRAVECTKAPLGVKLFVNLAWRGEDGLGEYVAERFDRALRFHDIIAARPGFEIPYVPESNILCFRYGQDNERQLAIRERLIETGEFHLSSVELGGRRHLRIVVMSPSTDEATIERLLDAIERVDGELG
jgi:L-2,4-diaminobutyrate decarboxylase